MSEWCAVCRQPLRFDLPECKHCGKAMEVCLGISPPPAFDPVHTRMVRFAKSMVAFQVRATGANAMLPN